MSLTLFSVISPHYQIVIIKMIFLVSRPHSTGVNRARARPDAHVTRLTTPARPLPTTQSISGNNPCNNQPLPENNMTPPPKIQVFGPGQISWFFLCYLFFFCNYSSWLLIRVCLFRALSVIDASDHDRDTETVFKSVS